MSPKALAPLKLMSSGPNLGMQWRRGLSVAPRQELHCLFQSHPELSGPHLLHPFFWPELKATEEATKGRMSRATLKIQVTVS